LTAQYRHYCAAVHLSSDCMSCNLAYWALLPWERSYQFWFRCTFSFSSYD